MRKKLWSLFSVAGLASVAFVGGSISPPSANAAGLQCGSVETKMYDSWISHTCEGVGRVNYERKCLLGIYSAKGSYYFSGPKETASVNLQCTGEHGANWVTYTIG